MRSLEWPSSKMTDNPHKKGILDTKTDGHVRTEDWNDASTGQGIAKIVKNNLMLGRVQDYSQGLGTLRQLP